MPVRKLPSGKWCADFYPLGREAGKRVRKQFATKGEALAFEKFAFDPDRNKEWLQSKEDDRSLAQLVDAWYLAHGITLGDGKKRLEAMKYACECMSQPAAIEFSAELFSKYRQQRLAGTFSRTDRVKQVSPRTVNLELSYFKAVFNELRRLGQWKLDNPLSHLRPFRIGEGEMAFLSDDEIDRLLLECENSSNKSLKSVVKLCLMTGARWSEAESLTRSQLNAGKVTFIKTKGKRNRTVPIDMAFYESLTESNKSTIFAPCYTAFRTALKRTGIMLPAGQLSHVLRHTFASHFMMNGGNILVLQRILGHTDIKMTMRYAHFAPEHLEDALRFNPLSRKVSQ